MHALCCIKHDTIKVKVYFGNPQIISELNNLNNLSQFFFKCKN